MSQFGMGAMLHYLGGGSEHNPNEYYDKKITHAEINDERLIIRFYDGVSIKIFDDGQTCCESRYITCDDDPEELIGGELIKIEAVDCGIKEDSNGWGESHEWVFINVQSSTGSIQFQNHNEHNGYYGGFGLTITEEAT